MLEDDGAFYFLNFEFITLSFIRILLYLNDISDEISE